MSADTTKLTVHSIHRDIESHRAWYGSIPGLKADKMLRNRKTPFLYILRAGEHASGDKTDYYVSFLLADLTIRHQPFVITVTPEGWHYENYGRGGPYTRESIEDVLHLMMHCQKEDGVPLMKLKER